MNLIVALFRLPPSSFGCTPPRNRTSSCGFENRRASITLARHGLKCPDLGSNQDHDLRRVGCAPLHHRDSNGARIRTPWSGFGDRLLSQEHAAVI